MEVGNAWFGAEPRDKTPTHISAEPKMKSASLIMCVCLLVAVSVKAQGPNIEVRPAGKELVETEPRRIVTTALRVTNLTDNKRECVSEVTLPKGWTLITKDFPFEVNPNASDTKLLSFFIPQATLAGKYEITYVVRDRNYPSIRDFYSIYIVVLPVVRLYWFSVNWTNRFYS